MGLVHKILCISNTFQTIFLLVLVVQRFLKILNSVKFSYLIKRNSYLLQVVKEAGISWSNDCSYNFCMTSTRIELYWSKFSWISEFSAVVFWSKLETCNPEHFGRHWFRSKGTSDMHFNSWGVHRETYQIEYWTSPGRLRDVILHLLNCQKD